MNAVLLVLAFLLVLVGYGTKVGLAPMHSWLPDAHSESPAPVSAMLSGALLNTAMIGIVRFLGITREADLDPLPQLALVAFGVLSLLDRRAFHRAAARDQAADGVLERRAYGRGRARLRLRRSVRRGWRALPHAQSLAEQIAHVLRGRQHDARLRHEGHRAYSRRRTPLSHAGCALACGRYRHHRGAALRAVPQRVLHHARRARSPPSPGRCTRWPCS